MMKSLLTISLAFFATTSQAQASEQRIGFTAGSTSGVGLSYSRQNSLGTGWQASLLPIYDAEGDAKVFVGGTVFRTLNATSWGRAYMSFGLALFYNRQQNIEVRSDCNDEGYCVDTEIDHGTEEMLLLSFGPSVGLERRWQQFALAFDLPLAVQFGADLVNNGGGFIGVHPIPNVSLMYFW